MERAIRSRVDIGDYSYRSARRFGVILGERRHWASGIGHWDVGLHPTQVPSDRWPVPVVHAGVAELADARDLGSRGRKAVQVRFLSPALRKPDARALLARPGLGALALTTLEWVFVVIVVLVVFGGGSWVAVWWWRLVARAAPYQDEVGRERGRKRGEDGTVVVVGTDMRPPPPGDKPAV